MVRPSNPRLTIRVLDAVTNLGNSKGSQMHDILDFIKRSNVSSKNLTMQVQRAVKHAVNAGLLRHRSGRYKVLVTLNRVSVPPAQPTKQPANDDQKTDQKKLKPDARAPIAGESSRRTRDSKKKTTSRRRSSKRRSSNTKRKSRRPSQNRRAHTTVQNKKRKRARKDEECENQSSERYILHGRQGTPAPFDRRAKRSKVSKRELESDFSDESDCESDVNRKRAPRATASSRHREPKQKETRSKSRDRSASQSRSLQLPRTEARQRSIENDNQQCDEDRGFMEDNTVMDQEPYENVEGTREPDDSNSGSTLENS